MKEKTDAELLAEFSEKGDASAQAAFAALVERHGPMVHAVARRVMSNHHDAEDIAQAVFVVLSRNAGKLRHQSSVAGCTR